MFVVAQMRRWFPFAVATLATVLLAGGFGLAIDHFATPHTQPAPQLKTVPAATLSRLGITLSAPAQPLYCGVAGTIVSHGWLNSGAAGCPISQGEAEAAARQGGSVHVVESVLALVTSSRVTALGHDLLAWVVVTQQTLRSSCTQRIGGYQVCVGNRGGPTAFAWTQLVVVDAHTGGIVNQARLSPTGGGRIRPFPVPGTVFSGA
jgi:hypothetical protein